MGRFVRAAANVVKFVAIVVVLGLVAGWSRNGVPSYQAGQLLALEGTVVIRAVDAQRVLIAVDASNEGKQEDGNFEHLFLYTGPSGVKVAPQTLAGAHVEHGRGGLVVIRNGVTVLQVLGQPDTPTRPATAVLSAGGLSHYWGPFGSRIDDLKQPTRSDACENACFRLGSREIEFPM